MQKEKAQVLSHQVPKLYASQRIADYARGLFLPYPTKTAIKKALKKKLVRVNNELADTATWIRGGETISIEIPEPDNRSTSLKLDLEVVFQDEYLAIINKPAGIQVSGNRFVTIANALPQNLKASAELDACTPWPIHRLDYGTTGILVVGKTGRSIRDLSEQFEKKRVQKTYYAIAIGQMPISGFMDAPIDEKEAFTSYEVEETVSSKRFDQLNLVKLHPETGRRHQIRKHLAEIGCPVLGDKDYGKEGLILNGKGIYLHANGIEFRHPSTSEIMNFTVPLPQKYLKIFPDHQND